MSDSVAARGKLLEVAGLNMHFTSGRGGRKTVIKAVDDVSFYVQSAETFGLVGESGCGKTTTGRTIIRLYNATSGSVRFGGREIAGPMTRDLRRYITDNISMIFQDPVDSLNPRMTIEEIISEGVRVRGERDRALIRAKVLEVLDQVGLTEEHATRYPHEFSGGQRQRVGIARAIITRPRLIIADEPVSALDVSIQAQVINLLNDLKQELGLTIIFIAHDLSVVKYFSDRIGVMYNGQLVEIARSDDLYKNPVHPYTLALLSAIPRPNPRQKSTQLRRIYNPQASSAEPPVMTEVEPEHFALLSPSEHRAYTERTQSGG